MVPEDRNGTFYTKLTSEFQDLNTVKVEIWMKAGGPMTAFVDFKADPTGGMKTFGWVFLEPCDHGLNQ